MSETTPPHHPLLHSRLTGLVMLTACGAGDTSLRDRPFDAVAWATTHNSMSAASDGWLVPSQEHGELRQLHGAERH